MIKSKVVVVGFLYPGVEQYVKDYLLSISKQSFSDFDLYLYNDGCDTAWINKVMKEYSIIKIILQNTTPGVSPATLRELAILELKNQYDFIIFSDTDDFHGENRIQMSYGALQNYNFCYNNMYLIDHNGLLLDHESYYKNKNNPMILNHYDQLLYGNYCGLSNTGICVKTTDLSELRIPSNLIAVDWWIYSMLLIKGFEGCFINNAYTYYRQYDNNTVGGSQRLTPQKVHMGIKIKKDHYRLLQEFYPSDNNLKINAEYEQIVLMEEIIKDETILRQYINNANKDDKEYSWWEKIRYNERWFKQYE